MCDDAETVMLGLGSVTDDAQAVAAYLRRQGKKSADLDQDAAALPRGRSGGRDRWQEGGHVLERSDVTALSSLVMQALFKARENAAGARHAGIPALAEAPKLTTAIFGLGAHDLQPRHLIAAYRNMETANSLFVYLGSAFFAKNPTPHMAALLAKMKRCLRRDRADGARNRGQPEPATVRRFPNPLPFRRRLRHDRHWQIADRHPRRRARIAFQGGAEIRFGKERRANQLLHHIEPRARAADQRRPRGRRDRLFRPITECSRTAILCGVWWRAEHSSCNPA